VLLGGVAVAWVAADSAPDLAPVAAGSVADNVAMSSRSG
jgi:hypothetical protein